MGVIESLLVRYTELLAEYEVLRAKERAMLSRLHNLVPEAVQDNRSMFKVARGKKSRKEVADEVGLSEMMIGAFEIGYTQSSRPSLERMKAVLTYYANLEKEGWTSKTV